MMWSLIYFNLHVFPLVGILERLVETRLDRFVAYPLFYFSLISRDKRHVLVQLLNDVTYPHEASLPELLLQSGVFVAIIPSASRLAVCVVTTGVRVQNFASTIRITMKIAHFRRSYDCISLLPSLFEAHAKSLSAFRCVTVKQVSYTAGEARG